MGLLDYKMPDMESAQGQGLLAAAFNLMQAKGPSFGNAIGQAGGQYMQTYADAKNNIDAKRLRDMQIEHYQTQMEQAKAEREKAMKIQNLAGAFRTPAITQGQVGSGPTNLVNDALPKDMQIGALPAVAPRPAGFDRQGYGAALEGIDPVAGFNYLQGIQKEDAPVKLGAGESLFSGKASGYKPILSVPKVSTDPAEVLAYKFAQSQGETRNYTDWVMAQKRAGATNVSTKIENKMGEGVAAQIGPMLKDSYTAAQGAVQQIDAANRIVAAIDSGKIIAGPLAGGRLQIAQIGQMLGVSGKDDAETIARSREVIRGLSEMTLQGRKQMSGQGAITESEGKLAEKANSGDIADLTPSEIKQLAKASARAAKFVYQNHQSNLGNLQSEPGTSGLAKFYKVRPFTSGAADEQIVPSGTVNWGDLK